MNNFNLQFVDVMLVYTCHAPNVKTLENTFFTTELIYY